jgi:hypothetical protein
MDTPTLSPDASGPFCGFDEQGFKPWEWIATRADLIFFVMDGGSKSELSPQFRLAINKIAQPAFEDKLRFVLQNVPVRCAAYNQFSELHQPLDFQHNILSAQAHIFWQLSPIVSFARPPSVTYFTFSSAASATATEKQRTALDNVARQVGELQVRELLAELNALHRASMTRKLSDLQKRTKLLRAIAVVTAAFRDAIPRLRKDAKKLEVWSPPPARVLSPFLFFSSSCSRYTPCR